MTQITSLNDIDYKTNPEGRLLFAALAIMTTELYPKNTPDEVIEIINKRADSFLPSKEQNAQVSDTTGDAQ